MRETLNNDSRVFEWSRYARYVVALAVASFAWAGCQTSPSEPIHSEPIHRAASRSVTSGSERTPRAIESEPTANREDRIARFNQALATRPIKIPFEQTEQAERMRERARSGPRSREQYENQQARLEAQGDLSHHVDEIGSELLKTAIDGAFGTAFVSSDEKRQRARERRQEAEAFAERMRLAGNGIDRFSEKRSSFSDTATSGETLP